MAIPLNNQAARIRHPLSKPPAVPTPPALPTPASSMPLVIYMDSDDDDNDAYDMREHGDDERHSKASEPCSQVEAVTAVTVQLNHHY